MNNAHYVLVERKTVEKLNEAVTEYLQRGYRLWGAPFIIKPDDAITVHAYYQAVYLDERIPRDGEDKS